MKASLTWPELLDQHRIEKYYIVRDALRLHGWIVARAARYLGTTPSSIRRVIDSAPYLSEQVHLHNPGRGRIPK